MPDDPPPPASAPPAPPASIARPGPLVSVRFGHLACWIDPAQWDSLGLAHDTASVERLVRTILTKDGEITPLKDDRSSLVWHLEKGVREWVVKQRRQNVVKALVYHAVRRSASWREWRGARRLAAVGAPARQPLVLIFDCRFGRWSETLVLPFLDVSSLDALIVEGAAGAPPPESRQGSPARRRLARVLGAQIGRITAAGLVNVDHKPTNLMMVEGVAQGRAEPVIIDTTAVVGRDGDERVVRMLYNLLRASRRVGPIGPREAMACLKAVLEVDPSLARGRPRRLRHVAQEVQRRLDAFYAEHDPHTMQRLPPEEIARRRQGR
ncbi:MAG: hypothetical protein NTW19_17905 [Planctomycetota bacterium]|nr:hypothetical protein [Planctomycetota bacterium]